MKNQTLKPGKITGCLLMLAVLTPCPVFAKDIQPSIQTLVNQEIVIQDNWAGQSITLIKEKDQYFILRKIFGSGVPVARTIKYRAVFDGENQLSFSGNAADRGGQPVNEKFTLSIDRYGTSLYLNGLKVTTK